MARSSGCANDDLYAKVVADPASDRMVVYDQWNNPPENTNFTIARGGRIFEFPAGRLEYSVAGSRQRLR